MRKAIIEDFETLQSPLSNRFETERIFDSRGVQKSLISDDSQIAQNRRVIQSALY